MRGDLPRTGLPRASEVALALAGLLICAPLIAAAAVCLYANSPGPILFRQQRMGRNARRFTFVKMRTMRSADGPLLTAEDDVRIFPVGRFLRRTKIDELPGLWNVLTGDMAIVGPRPEVSEYVDETAPEWQEVLLEKPGLTHPVTLMFREEERLLAAVQGNAEDFYRSTLLPAKLEGYLQYARKRTWQSDVQVIGKTLKALLIRPGVQPVPLPGNGLDPSNSTRDVL